MALSLAQDWKSVDELVTTKVRQFLAQAHTLWSALLVFECCPCALESLYSFQPTTAFFYVGVKLHVGSFLTYSSHRKHLFLCLIILLGSAAFHCIPVSANHSCLLPQGVFGVGKKKKSPIGFERVVKTISMKKHRAPDSVSLK